MHCRIPGLCLALSCINSCINLSPANLDILRAETHFQFGCYRTPIIGEIRPSLNTVHLEVQKPHITDRVFWDRQRWRVFLPACQPAFV